MSMKSIITRLKGMISPTKLIMGILSIAQKPLAAALTSALATQGIVLPADTADNIISVLSNVVKEHI